MSALLLTGISLSAQTDSGRNKKPVTTNPGKTRPDSGTMKKNSAPMKDSLIDKKTLPPVRKETPPLDSAMNKPQ